MSCKFLDGPAAGVRLQLGNPTIMLRVVQGPKGFDALDQPTDRPADDETIHVYIAVGSPTYAHVDYTEGGRRRGRRVVFQDYRHFPDQPGPEHTRDLVAWRAWCNANEDGLMQVKKVLEGISL